MFLRFNSFSRSQSRLKFVLLSSKYRILRIAGDKIAVRLQEKIPHALKNVVRLSNSHNELTLKRAKANTSLVSILLLGGIFCGLPVSLGRAQTNGEDKANHDLFTFVRIQYSSSGGFGESWYRYEGRDWERWETDFPRAEKNLLIRLKELTSITCNPKPISLRLTDDRLSDYPFIFMSDVGWMRLSDSEKESLADYLAAGGFLWIDDFWGDAEWQNLVINTKFPRRNWSWKRIPNGHGILSIVYPLRSCPQIPARIFFAQTGLPYDPPAVHRFPTGGVNGVNQVNFMGLFNGHGQLVAVATHNTDIADGWEREGESKDFFDRFSIDSYAMAINILVYATTH